MSDRGSSDPIVSTALYDEVADRLRTMIFERKLGPGTRIDEVALAKGFGVSRTPMREALKVLQRECLVDLVPRRGCFVAQLQPSDVTQIFAILILLESEAAADAARALKPIELRRLEQLQGQMAARAKAGAHQKYGELNQEFHEMLLTASGNPWRRRTIDDLRRILRLASQISLNRAGRLERSMTEHADLLAALRQRDEALARDAMRRHLEGQEAAILEATEPVRSEVA